MLHVFHGMWYAFKKIYIIRYVQISQLIMVYLRNNFNNIFFHLYKTVGTRSQICVLGLMPEEKKTIRQVLN